MTQILKSCLLLNLYSHTFRPTSFYERALTVVNHTLTFEVELGVRVTCGDLARDWRIGSRVNTIYLLDVVLLDSLRGAIDSVLLHVLAHVGVLDDGFAVGHLVCFLLLVTGPGSGKRLVSGAVPGRLSDCPAETLCRWHSDL